MMVSPLEVVEAVAKNMDIDGAEDETNEFITPFEEIDSYINRTPDVPTMEKAIQKTTLLVDVLRKYLIPCLMATPLVYLSDDSWEFHDHKVFRTARRKELDDLTESLKTNAMSSNVPTAMVDKLHEIIGSDSKGRSRTENIETLLPSIIEGLEKVFLEVLKVRLPAMPSLYLTDNFFDTVPVKEAYQEIIDKLEKNRKLDPRTRVYGLSQLFLQFLLLCPVGRPQIYVSDTEWKLISEKDYRASLREEILRR